jgi:hypothetical protein
MTYWGIRCRSCSQLVAFDVAPFHEFGLGSVNDKPGAVRCVAGHNCIYFPRDFRFYDSPVAISGDAMEKNRATYHAVNSSASINRRLKDQHDGVSMAPARPQAVNLGPQAIQPREETGSRPLSSTADPRRETAQKAARAIWANWAKEKAR